MRGLCIEHSVAVMARTTKTVKDDYESFGISSFTARVYETLFGLNEVPVAEPGEIDGLLNVVLSRVLMGVNDPSKIRVVVHVHTGPIVGLPGAPALLHALRRAGVQDAMFFGVCCNRCVSFFNALDLVRRYLQSEPQDARGLAISGEVACTNELRLVQNVAIAGDAVGAMLVNLEGPGDRMLSCKVLSDGRFARGVWLEGNLKGDYGFALLRLGIKGEDGFGAARLADDSKTRNAAVVAGAVLLLTGMVDLLLAGDFDFYRGSHSALIVAVANMISLPLIAYAVAVVGEGGAIDGFEDSPDEPEDATTRHTRVSAEHDDAGVVETIHKVLKEQNFLNKQSPMFGIPKPGKCNTALGHRNGIRICQRTDKGWRLIHLGKIGAETKSSLMDSTRRYPTCASNCI